jgi:hypothetical protein
MKSHGNPIFLLAFPQANRTLPATDRLISHHNPELCSNIQKPNQYYYENEKMDP